MFTRYLTNCEEERSNTLIEALIIAEKLKRSIDASDSQTSIFDVDTTLIEDDATKKVRFASNVSELVNSLDENDSCIDHDRGISVSENDLKSWLQIVRNEASAVLKLISDHKNDASCERRSSRDEGVQTEVSAEQLDGHEERIRCLQDVSTELLVR